MGEPRTAVVGQNGYVILEAPARNLRRVVTWHARLAMSTFYNELQNLLIL